jgi:hypothetical protein
MKSYIEHHDSVNLGFKILPWFKIDIERLREWHKDLEEMYHDWKFIVKDHEHVWREPISDPTGLTGHIIPGDTGYYTLCWGTDVEGPLPFEQGRAKTEYQDKFDNDELNPRKCFTGYGLEIVKSLPIRSKKWLVTDQPTGFKLITHQDNPSKIRIHIPIYVDDTSNWIIDGEEMFMEPGWVYIVNTSLPHSVENKGKNNRVHLYGKVWTKEIEWLLQSTNILEKN